MTKLQELYDQQGQSPWLDNLRRDYITGGTLKGLVDKGIRGVTSNPTIFAKAIESEDDYDAQFESLLPDHTIEQSYWELVIEDISTRSKSSGRCTNRREAQTGTYRSRWHPRSRTTRQAPWRPLESSMSGSRSRTST